MNYTNILLKILTNNRGVNTKKLSLVTEDRYPNIYNYIMNIYQDSSSIHETLKRLPLHIDIKPTCPICGKPVAYIGKKDNMFGKYCSNSCRAKDPQNYQKWVDGQKRYNLEHYGVEHNFQREDVIKKRIETFKTNYGTSNTHCIPEIKEKMINTSLEKYGTKSPSSSTVVRKKVKETWIKKYGVDNPTKNKYIAKKISITHLSEQYKQLIYNIKKANGTFNTSSTEIESYNILVKKYPNTQKQYRSEQYPFNCDFYIPELDLYIECNYHWTHGGHPYNEANDIDTLNELVEKPQTSDFYKNAINTWTIRDVKKFETAKQNNLNYQVFYTIDELKEWIML